jgi:hypothetical protein
MRSGSNGIPVLFSLQLVTGKECLRTEVVPILSFYSTKKMKFFRLVTNFHGTGKRKIFQPTIGDGVLVLIVTG